MTSAGEDEIQKHLRVVRTMADTFERDLREVIDELVPEALRDAVMVAAARDAGEIIKRVRGVSREGGPKPWWDSWDPSDGYYWRRQREYLLDVVGRSPTVLESLDDDSDRVLSHLEDPRPSGPEAFSTRGLVLGYVQSGKTANISAVIAKAADVGYRVIIVLSGMHNGLRRQTQQRLDRELGLVNGVGVGLPVPGRRWITMTDARLHGDFDPGTSDPNVLQGNDHVIFITKKNARVLDRLNDFIAKARMPTGLPVLIIDDEADQASINTGGNRPMEEQLEVDDEDVSEDDLSPSKINAKIRTLINSFQRVGYIGYTATPFANVLINHEAADREVLQDLYPKDFILSLPFKPGYVGTERLFGRGTIDGTPEDEREGLDVIRIIPDVDVAQVHPVGVRVDEFEPSIPPTLRHAIHDWILATGAMLERAAPRDIPSCLLIHTHQQTLVQNRLWPLLTEEIRTLRADWRYEDHLRPLLRERWDTKCRPITLGIDADRDRPFEAIEPFINQLFKVEVPVLALNSRSTEDLELEEDHDLDFEREPTFKGIVVGGNRLSRGMTLEGLSVSYYVRGTPYYDTLLQMARWFGYREDYVDLTRLWTTETLASWFRDLALREEDLRQQIAQAENERLTPEQVGYVIRSHPSMMVTAQNKMGAGRLDDLSYAGKMIQTSRFRLDTPDWLQANLDATRRFLAILGPPSHDGDANRTSGRLVWRDVPAEAVTDLLAEYRTVQNRTAFDADTARRYITAQNANDELRRWQVAIISPATRDDRLGDEDLGVQGHDRTNLILRTRLKTDRSSVGVLTNPAEKPGKQRRRGDEEIGLTPEQSDRAREQLAAGEFERTRDALLAQRDPDTGGLLVIYPISRYSRPRSIEPPNNRMDLFPDPEKGVTVIGLAIAFPPSDSAATVEYVKGSVAQAEPE